MEGNEKENCHNIPNQPILYNLKGAVKYLRSTEYHFDWVTFKFTKAPFAMKD